MVADPGPGVPIPATQRAQILTGLGGRSFRAAVARRLSAAARPAGRTPTPAPIRLHAQ